MTNTPHRWGTIKTRFVRFSLSAKGAAAVDREAVHDEPAIADVRRQIEEYCAGERTTFDIERAARGSAFQHEVWEALMRIPFGQTASYGEVAKWVGQPHAARAVGGANATHPVP